MRILLATFLLWRIGRFMDKIASQMGTFDSQTSISEPYLNWTGSVFRLLSIEEGGYKNPAAWASKCATPPLFSKNAFWPKRREGGGRVCNFSPPPTFIDCQALFPSLFWRTPLLRGKLQHCSFFYSQDFPVSYRAVQPDLPLRPRPLQTPPPDLIWTWFWPDFEPRFGPEKGDLRGISGSKSGPNQVWGRRSEFPFYRGPTRPSALIIPKSIRQMVSEPVGPQKCKRVQKQVRTKALFFRFFPAFQVSLWLFRSFVLLVPGAVRPWKTLDQILWGFALCCLTPVEEGQHCRKWKAWMAIVSLFCCRALTILSLHVVLILNGSISAPILNSVTKFPFWFGALNCLLKTVLSSYDAWHEVIPSFRLPIPTEVRQRRLNKLRIRKCMQTAVYGGRELNTNFFFLKLFGRPRDIPAKSRDIPPKKFDFPGFEGHTELFGPHPFVWKTPTPPENIRA